LLFISEKLSAQSILNDKTYYDTLKSGKLSGKVGFGLNINQEDIRKTFLVSDATISYATPRHLFEMSDALYYNSNGTDEESNRLLIYIRSALFRHRFVNNKRIEAHLFPEINFQYVYDESRGLNFRRSATAGITYSLHHLSWARIKIGTGIMHERESWRIFEKSFLPTYDTLSASVKQLLQEKFGIDSKGNIVNSNWRWSNYIQLVANIGNKINITTMGMIQFPFNVPYNNPYNIDLFPVDNKKYPRMTAELAVNLVISGHVSFFTKFLMQQDKGQISPFADEFIYNLSQGIVYKF
jgi:hypothetical protein